MAKVNLYIELMVGGVHGRGKLIHRTHGMWPGYMARPN